MIAAGIGCYQRLHRCWIEKKLEDVSSMHELCGECHASERLRKIQAATDFINPSAKLRRYAGRLLEPGNKNIEESKALREDRCSQGL